MLRRQRARDKGVYAQDTPNKFVARIEGLELEREILQYYTVPRMPWSLVLVVYALVHFEASAQQMTCNANTEQPAVTMLNPPSGTTGMDSGLSSIYLLQGERLERILRMEIQFPPPQTISPRTPNILQRNSTEISFRIPQTSFQRMPGGTPAVLRIYPNNTACQNISLSMSLHETGQHNDNLVHPKVNRIIY